MSRRMSMRPLATVAPLILLFALTAAAADLPRWDDDSGITLTAYPRQFSPARESTNLVARVFHSLDVPADVAWTVEIRNGGGAVVRQFEAAQRFQPGEAILFAPTWNGRGANGQPLPDGAYTVRVSFEMRAAAERAA